MTVVRRCFFALLLATDARCAASPRGEIARTGSRVIVLDASSHSDSSPPPTPLDASTGERADRVTTARSSRPHLAPDAGVAFDGPPRSFAELLETSRPVYWRTSSIAGPKCVRWDTRRSRADGPPDVLSSTVEVLCVRHTTSVRLNLETSDTLVFDGIGGSTMTRTGGSGWMGPRGPRTTVTWVDSDERTVLTSEGPWFLSEEACMSASSELPSSRPAAWRSTMPIDDALRTASTLPEQRWAIASERPRGAPTEIERAVRTMFRQGRTVWQADVGHACKGWRVTLRDNTVQLVRDVLVRRGVRRVTQQNLRWHGACGSFEHGGCFTSLIGPNLGSTGGSSSERWFSIDRVGDGWIESEDRRLFSSQGACERTPRARRAPFFDSCE